MISQAPKRPNWAVNFDGTGDYISIASPSTSMPSGDGSFTVESWVYLNNHTNNHYLYYWGDDGNANQQNSAHFYESGGSYYFGHAAWSNDYNVVVGDKSGVWLHWAVTYDSGASERKLWINATQQGSTNNPSNFNVSANGRNFKIGATGDALADPIEGKMAEFRVWNAARTQKQLQDYMYERANGNESGLIVCFPLDEGTGTTVSDIALGGDGTLQGNPTWADGPPLSGSGKVTIL